MPLSWVACNLWCSLKIKESSIYATQRLCWHSNELQSVGKHLHPAIRVGPFECSLPKHSGGLWTGFTWCVPAHDPSEGGSLPAALLRQHKSDTGLSHVYMPLCCGTDSGWNRSDAAQKREESLTDWNEHSALMFQNDSDGGRSREIKYIGLGSYWVKMTILNNSGFFMFSLQHMWHISASSVLQKAWWKRKEVKGCIPTRRSDRWSGRGRDSRSKHRTSTDWSQTLWSSSQCQWAHCHPAHSALKRMDVSVLTEVFQFDSIEQACLSRKILTNQVKTFNSQ